MSVYQRKDDRWCVRYRDKETKKVIDKYFGRGLEAEKQARQYNESLGLRPYERHTPQEFSTTFEELAEAYLTAKKAHTQASTRQNFIWKMKGIILPELANNRALNLNAQRMDHYVNKRIKAGVKLTTIHRELSDIQAVLNWAADPDRQYIPYNPIARYKKPERDDEQIRPPSHRETLKLIHHCPPHLVRGATISYYTGIRPGARELFSRTWDDVDFDDKTIFVVSARKGGRMKSRNIPLHPNLQKLFLIWHDEDKKFEQKKEFFPERIVHYRGHAVKSLKKSWKHAKEKAGITRRLRLYDLRHAFASYTLKDGADLKSISETLGHSRTDTTTRIYQHTDTKMHRDAVNKMPSLDL